MALLCVGGLYVISINEESKNGTTQSKCWNTSLHLVICNSPYLAFKKVQNNTKIVINSSTLFLEQNIEIQGTQNIVITSNMTLRSSNPSRIICSKNGSFGIFNSQNVSILNLMMLMCGQSSYSVQKKHNWPAAIYLYSVSNVILKGVITYESKGVSVAMINVYGINEVTENTFSNGTVIIPNSSGSNYGDIGGGGLLVVHDKVHSTISSTSHLQSHTSIKSCIISLNKVRGGGGLGSKGGGIAIILSGNSSHNLITVQDTYLDGNRAVMGGGIFANYIGLVNNNHIIIKNLSIFGHNCFSLNHVKCIGGAINVQFKLDADSEIACNNSFTVIGSNISKNVAYAGGGISVSAAKQATERARSNKVILIESCLSYNRGQIGSSIYFSTYQVAITKSQMYTIVPTLNSVKILHGIVMNKSNVTVGEAALYTHNIPIWLKGNVTIEQCKGTAVVASGAVITVEAETKVNFANNSGKLGGALALINQAFLVVHAGSILIFQNNKANEKGGAIYLSNYFDNYAYPIAVHSCAIQYFTAPNKSNPHFQFINNKANMQRNSVFATSILSCMKYPYMHRSNFPFCWKEWTFANSSCEKEVFTLPSTIISTHNQTDSAISVIPGFPFNLPIILKDDYGKDVTNYTVLVLFILKGQAEVDSSTRYSAGGKVTIYGHPGKEATVGIETPAPRVVYTEVKVRFSHCPPGYLTKNYTGSEVKTCICGNNYKPNYVIQCNNDEYFARMLNGWCMTYENEHRTTIEGSWRFFSQLKYPVTEGYFELPKSVQSLDDFFCKPLNRTGRLCGKCQKDTGVSVYSYDFKCVPCSNKHNVKRLFLFLIVEIVPVTFFFVLVILLNVSITTGPANAFVLFSQLATLPTVAFLVQDQINGLVTSNILRSILLNVLTLPYSIWNLDFLNTLTPPFCISPNLTTMHITALGYISALYPLILLMLFYSLIELYACNCKPVRVVCRPVCILLGRFRRNWKIRSSIIEAFATFLILSYTKLCSVSFLLLVPNSIYTEAGEVKNMKLLYVDASVEYGSPRHRVLMVVAVLILFIIVFPLPVILLLYPLKVVQKLLNFMCIRRQSLVAFMDSFQGCYRDGSDGKHRDMRWFSSVYLFARIAHLTVTMCCSDVVTVRLLQIIGSCVIVLALMVLKPYKKEWHNTLDAIIFTILTFFSTFWLIQSFNHTSIINWTYVFLVVRLVPLFYMTLYVGYHVTQRFFGAKQKYGEYEELLDQHQTSHTFDDGSVPHRLLHPEGYNEISNQ